MTDISSSNSELGFQKVLDFENIIFGQPLIVDESSGQSNLILVKEFSQDPTRKSTSHLKTRLTYYIAGISGTAAVVLMLAGTPNIEADTSTHISFHRVGQINKLNTTIDPFMEKHRAYLVGELNKFSSISGFGLSSINQFGKLGWFSSDLREQRPGFQVTGTPSMILTVGKSKEKSAVAEMFFDEPSGRYDDSIALVLRSRGSFSLHKTSIEELRQKLSEFFA